MFLLTPSGSEMAAKRSVWGVILSPLGQGRVNIADGSTPPAHETSVGTSMLRLTCVLCRLVLRPMRSGLLTDRDSVTVLKDKFCLKVFYM